MKKTPEEINAEMKEKWVNEFARCFRVSNDISTDYDLYYTKAKELADDDVEKYPLQKNETLRDRMERHLIGMLEMHSQRYGVSIPLEAINDFIDNNKCPLCGEYSLNNEPHKKCMDYEAMRADME